MSGSQTKQSSIQVVVRVRPFTKSEKQRLISSALDTSNNSNTQRALETNGSTNTKMFKLGDDSISLIDTSLDSGGYSANNRNNGGSESDNLSLLLKLKPAGIRKIVDCVDDKMLIFDPQYENGNKDDINSYTTNNKVTDYNSNVSTIIGPKKRRTSGITNINGNAIKAKNTNKKSSRSLINSNSLLSCYNSNGLSIPRYRNEHRFIFDKLFDESATQQEVYECTTRPLLDSILDGYNCTVFAYGATGCGKTYTVSGDHTNDEDHGIIYKTMEELYCRLEEIKKTKICTITVSYLEIYNESIKDLLAPQTSAKKLVIREDSEQKITVSNLSYHTPETVQDVMDLITFGNQHRATSPTDANQTSSRSHAVLQIHVTQQDRNVSENLTENQLLATLSIIDLAGSERAAATKNRGERLQEGANINKSLLALGNCINALCSSGVPGGTVTHIPYRDSKLTRLLKFSLGGNCKTVMIVCCSPSSEHYDETLNTLKYANRAKEIKTKFIKNQKTLDKHVGSYLKIIQSQRKEIEELRNRDRMNTRLQINKYKIAREKLYMHMFDMLNKLQTNFNTHHKYVSTKFTKSLILCKRRFLQLLSLQIKQITKNNNNNDTLSDSTMQMCQQMEDKFHLKIIELEKQFDQTPDIFDLAIEHLDLQNLQNMESWNETVDMPILETYIKCIRESLGNEILTNSTLIMEELLKNNELVNTLTFSMNLDGNLGSYKDEQLGNILTSLKDIDFIFEKFGENIYDTFTRYQGKVENKEGKSLRWSDNVVEYSNTTFSISTSDKSDGEGDESNLDITMPSRIEEDNNNNRSVTTYDDSASIDEVNHNELNTNINLSMGKQLISDITSLNILGMGDTIQNTGSNPNRLSLTATSILKKK
ncbi:related to Kinesin-like protein KIP3 [Saccharomycodes ludwigii]|uniref:Kinesin-like protein n=1 Tax=Saccharomycodes ludwigii TaxID=36035 RepID=A0A376BB31_9ASCO|nr:related to Kinesin-like protein KIP3 [Saccharomycodes ludwigii]